MSSQRLTTVLTYGILSLAGIVSFSLPKALVPSSAGVVQSPPDVMELSGVIRDFKSDHPDFGSIDAADLGHYTGLVASLLGSDGLPVPVFVNNGQHVTSQWFDKDGNPIAPYAGPGLPGGHFDVDIYDEEPSDDRIFHQHQYDDKHDITYVDVVGNPLLKGDDFDGVVGFDYPNNLRIEFFNVHNGGGGTYDWHDTGAPVSGNTADGFTRTFDPWDLKTLRINFIALAFMAHTNPKDSEKDEIDRDDAFYLRMYDVVTDEMVYELSIYHHYKEGKETVIEPPEDEDACGEDIEDELGDYGDLGDAGITDLDSFDQWFRDELGANLPTGHTISLQRDDDDVYEYLDNSFYPIDGRLMGNDGDSHNNYFTYTLSASFTYDECTEQFFEFASNDDAWVFINDQLVLDIGGTATTDRQYVNLDRMGLVDGQSYTLDFFFAHRRNVLDSIFNMRTNIVLETGELPSMLGFYD